MNDRSTMRRHTDQAYLLRLWRDGAQTPLRATLITVATPQHCYHFTNLDELQSFLATQASLPAHDQNHCTSDEP